VAYYSSDLLYPLSYPLHRLYRIFAYFYNSKNCLIIVFRSEAPIFSCSLIGSFLFGPLADWLLTGHVIGRCSYIKTRRSSPLSLFFTHTHTHSLTRTRRNLGCFSGTQTHTCSRGCGSDPLLSPPLLLQARALASLEPFNELILLLSIKYKL